MRSQKGGGMRKTAESELPELRLANSSLFRFAVSEKKRVFRVAFKWIVPVGQI